MTKSNENMVTKLDDTYNNFEAALKNNPAKVKEKYDKAQEIKKLSKELVYTIDTVTYSFISEITQKADISIIDPNDKEKTIKRTINLMNADGSKNFDSIAEALRVGGFSWIQKLDNNHIGTPYFIGKAEGKEVSEGAAAEVKRRILNIRRLSRRNSVPTLRMWLWVSPLKICTSTARANPFLGSNLTSTTPLPVPLLSPSLV